MSPRVTLRSESTSDPPQYLYSLYFFSLPLSSFPSPFVATLSFTAHKVRVVLEHWFSTRPVPKRLISPLSCVTELYTPLSRKGNSCGRNVRDAVRHPILLPSACCTESTTPTTIDFQPSTLRLSPSREIIVCYAEHSSRKICKHCSDWSRSGDRGAGSEARRDEATNNVELTLVGHSKFNGWKAKHVSFFLRNEKWWFPPFYSGKFRLVSFSLNDRN